MTEFIGYMLNNDRTVAAVHIREKRLDIGQYAAYEQEQQMVKDWPITL